MGLLVCGIDPGVHGYFCVVNEAGVIDFRERMPLTGNKICPYGIWTLIKVLRLRAAEQGRKLIFGIEKVFTMPSDKRSSELILALRSEVDVVKVNGILDDLEKVLKRSDGRVGILSYGIGYGYLVQAAAITGCRTEVFNPRTWQAEMHKGSDAALKAKERSMQVFKRLWDEKYLFMEGSKAKKPPDGLVDAALIAEYTRRLIAVPLAAT